MTNCTLQQLSNGKWWCPECDENQEHLLPINAHRNCIKPLPLAKRIHQAIDERTDVTRSPEDLDRIITICTTQCKRLGTGQWGEVKYEGCPRFGQPCNGAFGKWMKSIADAKTWCEHFGPEQGVFRE